MSVPHHYVVHCRGDEDLRTTLCGPPGLRGREDGERHMALSATQVLSKRFSEEFSEGRTYFPSEGGSMRFCKACLNHPDLEMLALGEV